MDIVKCEHKYCTCTEAFIIIMVIIHIYIVLSLKELKPYYYKSSLQYYRTHTSHTPVLRKHLFDIYFRETKVVASVFLSS